MLDIGQSVSSVGAPDRDHAIGDADLVGGVVATERRRVVSSAAVDGVVSEAPRYHVFAAVAGQGVVMGRADQVLDRDQRVLARAAGILRRALLSKGDGHGLRRIRVGGGVRARAAVQDIGAIPAVQDVGPPISIEMVIAAQAREGVVEAPPDQVLAHAGPDPRHRRIGLSAVDDIGRAIGAGARCADDDVGQSVAVEIAGRGDGLTGQRVRSESWNRKSVDAV